MLETLWKNFNWPCGKLFAPFLRQNLDLIRLRKKYHMSDAVAGKLKKISPRTIDRLLRKPPSSGFWNNPLRIDSKNTGSRWPLLPSRIPRLWWNKN
jgi:hypothetical protein